MAEPVPGLALAGTSCSLASAWADYINLAQTMAQRIGHFLERQQLTERDIENSYLAANTADDDPMQTLLGHSITYRIAVGPQAGRKN